jgi:hypothetical protein
LPHGIDCFGDIAAVGMTIDHDAVAAAAAQQLMERHMAILALMSHNATSTTAIARIVTGPRRQ